MLSNPYRYLLKNVNKDIIKLLLQDPRVEPSCRYNKAIINAAKKGYKNTVKLLIKDKRVKPYDSFNKAIRVASANRHKLKILLTSVCKSE